MADVPQLGPDPSTAPRPVVGAGPILPPGLTPGNTPGDSAFVKFLHSLGAKKSGRYGIGLNKFALTWLAPAPVGIVPPKYFGLPEDYFFGFTPSQVLEFAENAGPQMAYEHYKEQERAALFLQTLNDIENVLDLRRRSDQELADLLKLLPDPVVQFDDADLTKIAIHREQQRRNTDLAAYNQMSLPGFPRATIKVRGTPVQGTAGFPWPDTGELALIFETFGFLDLLAGDLPPDP